MLEAVLEDDGRRSIAALARGMDMPVSTAHRQVATLVAKGYLAENRNGAFAAGPSLLKLLYRLDEREVIADLAAPCLDRLAADLRSVAQFGTFENDMVTYRVKAGEGATRLFTRTGMQLEAYCSAIGKVLLAHLPERERQAYLADGPFVALTPKTIVDPIALERELQIVGAQDFAEDAGEISDDLFCLAVPVRNPQGRVIAAISVSRNAATRDSQPGTQALSKLRATACEIEKLCSA